MSHGTREPAPNDSRNQDSPLPAYSGRARSRHRQSRIVDSAALEDEMSVSDLHRHPMERLIGRFAPFSVFD